MIEATIVVGELPEGVCYPSEQARLNGYAEALTITFPVTASTFNYGPTTPTVDNQGFPWLRTDSNGRIDKWANFSNGSWISLNPTPASSPTRLFYRAAAATIDTYDGGEAGAVTATTGPMWEIDTEMSGVFPLGVSGSHAFNATGGAENVTLTNDQIPGHAHEIPTNISLASTGGNIAQGGDNLISFAPGDRINSAFFGGGESHTNMPPWRAGFWIKRTARTHYRY